MASTFLQTTLQSPPSRRRRQRSVRVSVAVALMGLATLVVLVAVIASSSAWLTPASLLAVAAGWAAARIIHTELVQSRRDNATDRAAQARAYRSIFAERSLEHAEFASAMVGRVTARDRAIAELTVAVADAARRVTEAESRVQRECRRADDADASVAELLGRIELVEARKAEHFDQLAGWEGFETVVDMMAWEHKIAARHRAGAVEETRPA